MDILAAGSSFQVFRFPLLPPPLQHSAAGHVMEGVIVAASLFHRSPPRTLGI